MSTDTELPPGWSLREKDTVEDAWWIVCADARVIGSYYHMEREVAVRLAWLCFGVTREEWARLQGLGESLSGAEALLDIKRDVITELRAKLTEAEGLAFQWEADEQVTRGLLNAEVTALRSQLQEARALAILAETPVRVEKLCEEWGISWNEAKAAGGPLAFEAAL